MTERAGSTTLNKILYFCVRVNEPDLDATIQLAVSCIAVEPLVSVLVSVFLGYTLFLSSPTLVSASSLQSSILHLILCPYVGFLSVIQHAVSTMV